MANNSSSSSDKFSRRWIPWIPWIPWILGIAVALIFAIRIAEPIVAYDIWWHMALGRDVLNSGSLISDHSLYTWTPATAYAVYNAWLAQVALYLWYELSGTTGLIALRYLVFFGFFLLALHYAARRDITANPLSWMIILLGVMILSPTYPVKPELFTIGFMCLTVWLYFTVRAGTKSNGYLFYLLPLIIIVWVNSHGAFFVVSVFLTAAAVGELLNAKFSPSQAMPAPLRRHFFIALGLCAPAVLLNPFGLELPLHLINTALSSEAAGDVRTMGFRPTFLFNDPPHYMLDYMLAAMVVFVFLVWQKLKNRKTDWVVILCFLAFCILYTKYVRLTLFLAPVFVFACLDLLSEKNKSWAWPAAASGRLVLYFITIGMIIIAGWRVIETQECDLRRGFANLGEVATQPVAEAEFIKANLNGRKIGNLYNDGGYLIWALWPHKQAMIDTRNFPFKEWIEDYFTFHFGENIADFVTSMKADYWFVNYRNIGHYIWFLESRDWEPVYLGPVGAIFVPFGEHTDKPIISEDLAKLTAHDAFAQALNAALQLNDLTFAGDLYQAAVKNLNGQCSADGHFKHEMNSLIEGFNAFNSGDYQNAVEYLGEAATYIRADKKRIEAMEILARTAWEKGDYEETRAWSVEILAYPAHIVNIYNFMLADWHLSQTFETSESSVDDDLNWEAYADYILANEAQLDQSHQTIIETARALKSGQYDGKGYMLSRFGPTEIEPGGSTRGL